MMTMMKMTNKVILTTATTTMTMPRMTMMMILMMMIIMMDYSYSNYVTPFSQRSGTVAQFQKYEVHAKLKLNETMPCVQHKFLE